jgi:dienelactone hydrolase
MQTSNSVFEETVRIDTRTGSIYGSLATPERAWGAVLLTAGCGSSRNNPRNRIVAEALQEVGLVTLSLDLLTPAEERIDAFTARHRFDVRLLAFRLSAATDWLDNNFADQDFRIGYFGASTGAAAALKAAADRVDIFAVVSRGGRPDLAGEALAEVNAATLLIVGGLDRPVIDLNRFAYDQLTRAYRREIAIVSDATHLFDEHGALNEVSRLAGQWFVRYLGAAACRGEQSRNIYAGPPTRFRAGIRHTQVAD